MSFDSQFYISDPKSADRPRATSPDDGKDYETYWENVKAVHQVCDLQLQPGSWQTITHYLSSLAIWRPFEFHFLTDSTNTSNRKANMARQDTDTPGQLTRL